MMFWDEALPYAQQAHTKTGVLVSVVLAQWAEETGYGGVDWSVHHNPGNVGSFDGQPVNSFPTLQAGVDAYVQTIMLSYYVAVREAKGYIDQCHALGESPWASAHYESSGPPMGEDLIKIIVANGLTKYDVVPAPPIPKVDGQRVIAGMFYTPNPPHTGDWLVYKTNKASIPKQSDLVGLKAHGIPLKVLTQAEITKLKKVNWGAL